MLPPCLIVEMCCSHICLEPGPQGYYTQKPSSTIAQEWCPPKVPSEHTLPVNLMGRRKEDEDKPMNLCIDIQVSSNLTLVPTPPFLTPFTLATPGTTSICWQTVHYSKGSFPFLHPMDRFLFIHECLHRSPIIWKPLPWASWLCIGTQLPSTVSECMTFYTATHSIYNQVDCGLSVDMHVFPDTGVEGHKQASACMSSLKASAHDRALSPQQIGS